MQNSESLKQQCLNQLIGQQQREEEEEGGTVPSDKSQPTERRQEGTIMTGPTHEKCQNSVIPASRPIWRRGEWVGGHTCLGWTGGGGHDTDMNLYVQVCGQAAKKKWI